MAIPPTRVELFYDVISPFSWLAFEALCRYRPIWNVDLALRPFRIRDAMNETGNKPPWMSVPAKNKYIVKDLTRSAAHFQVPIQPIEDLYHVLVEKGSLRPQRFLSAISLHFPDYLEEVSRQLWLRVWSRGEDITEDKSLHQAAENAKMIDGDIDKCISLIDDPTTEGILNKNSKEAIDHGAFGAPIIVVHTPSGPEMFFGADRFEMIAGMINEVWKGPNPTQDGAA